jgi:hypothetical protein
MPAGRAVATARAVRLLSRHRNRLGSHALPFSQLLIHGRSGRLSYTHTRYAWLSFTRASREGL